MSADGRHVRGRDTCQTKPPVLRVGEDVLCPVVKVWVLVKEPVKLRANVQPTGKPRRSGFRKGWADGIIGLRDTIGAEIFVIKDRRRERSVICEKDTGRAMGRNGDRVDTVCFLEIR